MDMLGALGGVSVVALFLVKDKFRPAVFALWSMVAGTMYIHEHSAELMAVFN